MEMAAIKKINLMGTIYWTEYIFASESDEMACLPNIIVFEDVTEKINCHVKILYNHSKADVVMQLRPQV